MKPIARIFLPALTVSLFALGLFATQVASAPTAWSLTRPAGSFDRSALTRPEYAQKIRFGGTLSGAKDDWGITGWVEYDIEVPRSGWYELTVKGGGREVEYLIDPGSPPTSGAVSVYNTSGHSLAADKVGNFWLTSGRHTLRLQRYFWTGFPRIESLTLTAGSTALAKSMRVAIADSAGISRLHKCAPMEVFSGGRNVGTTLDVWIKDASGKLLHTESLAIPRSQELLRQTVALPCDEPGVFTVNFGENGAYIPYPDVRSLVYEVIDTARSKQEIAAGQSAAAKAGSAPVKTLVEDIDCVSVPPDYSSGGETRVITTAQGIQYRESGETGFTRFQRAPSDAVRKALPAPSWFAYRLHSVVPQKPYLVEVDYPDDRMRSFAIALRESAPLSYPVAGGVDSGGEFSLSNKMLTQSLLYWPRAAGTRVTLLNAHDGRRAAAAKIRVYRLDGKLPPLVPEGTAGRHFLNWYEEGSNFLSMYGAPDDSATGLQVATERWAQAVRYAGGSVLAPTVAIYSFALYPSRYNLAFSKPDQDYLRRILLVAEQNGLKVLPELHPRADELAWSARPAADPPPNLLVSKDGKTSGGLPPLYNPLYPANQEWYLGMIGELADRYRDSPALLGVNLRLMQWANPALNNFHSLDWGYDDYTVELFKKETGSTVPLGSISDKSRFANRYVWLMANARAQWIDWRCRKIADLYTRIRDRVRQARPDLKVYSSVFQWEPADVPIDALRGAGIDPAMLREIAGVELVNALHAYGRKEADTHATQLSRDALLDPVNLELLSGTRAQGHFLTGANYIEITEAIAPPQALGFPASTKLTWTSATANPARRHHLERFAIELAETDATMLGDGGNAYSLGQPLLGDWIREYRALPAVPFLRREDAVDPVAVWTREDAGGLKFYVVNRERYAVPLRLSILGTRQVTRIATGEPLLLTQGKMTVKLAPYQLLAYSAPPGSRIMDVSQSPPAVEVQRVQAQVAWVAELDKKIRSNREVLALAPDLLAVLSSTVEQAQAALARRHYWRARVLLEDHRMMQIYLQAGEQPPDLRDAVVAE